METCSNVSYIGDLQTASGKFNVYVKIREEYEKLIYDMIKKKDD